MADKPIDVSTQRLKNGGSTESTTKKGDFRKWHPARTADGASIPKNAEAQNFANITKNRNFTLNDYVWNNRSAGYNFGAKIDESSLTDDLRNLRSPNGDGVHVPKIILKEFQPDFLFNWGDVVDNAIGGALKAFSAAGERKSSSNNAPESGSTGTFSKAGNAFTAVGGADTLRALGQGAARLASQNHINTLIENISRSRGEFSASIVEKPVDLVRQMFSGEFLSEYEVPYYGDTYLKAESNANWSRSGLSQQIGSKIGTFLKENMSLDVPTTPTWKNADGGGMPPPIEAEVILFNRDIDALIANYRFIHALIAGVYWTQINYNQKSPNLFDVTIPGRLHYYYCSMDMEVNFLGKSRSLNGATLDRFISAFGKTGGNNNFKVGGDHMFPDGYEVKITLQSLMPNNFNMYLDYLLNGSQETGVIDRVSPIGIVGGVLSEVGDNLSNVGGTAAKTFNELLKSGESRITSSIVGDVR